MGEEAPRPPPMNMASKPNAGTRGVPIPGMARSVPPPQDDDEDDFPQKSHQVCLFHLHHNLQGLLSPKRTKRRRGQTHPSVLLCQSDEPLPPHLCEHLRKDFHHHQCLSLLLLELFPKQLTSRMNLKMRMTTQREVPLRLLLRRHSALQLRNNPQAVLVASVL